MQCIFYKKGYKYQLVQEYTEVIPICPEQDIDTEYVKLSNKGELWLKKGYAWDGPSGPTIDTHTFMRGSLVHDALYQLMRNEKLSNRVFRKPIDQLLRQQCTEDGMNPIRAWWVYLGVRIGGKPAADPAHSKPIIKAPKGCTP